MGGVEGNCIDWVHSVFAYIALPVALEGIPPRLYTHTHQYAAQGGL